MRASILAAGAALSLLSLPALADTGVPPHYFEGGGCFNFTMNGITYSVPGITYSVPEIGVGGAETPRGGQATIDGWKAILLAAPFGTVTVTRQDGDRTICPLGDYFFKGASSP